MCFCIPLANNGRCVERKIDALVTAPISKHNIQNEQFKFPGHTEYLTEKAGAKDSLMLMINELMRIGVVTGHIPLSSVKEALTKRAFIIKKSIQKKKKRH